jgi:hypothetical protein
MNLRIFRIAFLLLFNFSFLLAQVSAQDNYEKDWKRVAALATKNRPASALEIVRKIYTQAKQDKNDAQLLKTLLYISGLQYPMRNDNEFFSILDIEKELPSANELTASVLKNILAEIYLSYFREKRWNLYNRSKTAVAKSYDIATWSAEDFHEKISSLYLESIQPVQLLQQTTPAAFEPVIVRGNVRVLRPTLYDMLANRALDYLGNDEITVTKSAYAFEISDAEAFAPAADFSRHVFAAKDSASPYYHALTLFQELTRFHLTDDDPAALIDLDIRRLQFCYYKSIHPDKQVLYLDALRQLTKKYTAHPAAAQAWHLLALDHANKADQYKPYEDSAWRLDHIKAKAICDTVLKQSVESEGWTNCFNLLQRITHTHLDFQLEKINIPNEPFRVFVRYRNLASVYVSVVRVDDALRRRLQDRTGDMLWLELSAAKPLSRYEQPLPSSGDMQQHEMEIKVDALPVGEYWLIMSTAKDFSNDKTLVAGRTFHVSNISYVSSGNDYFVLDRNSGQPLAGATVRIWERTYNSSMRVYVNKEKKDCVADERGYFFADLMNLPNEKESWRRPNYEFMINYRGEQLHTGDAVTSYFYYTPKKEDNYATLDSGIFLFTDRGIYRPGQTLFFKGIAIEHNVNRTKNRVLDVYETIIYLCNANDQRIDSMKVKTNAFGSFSGTFRLPATGRNGLFSLRSKDLQRRSIFHVEEYKRPTYEVRFEPIKETYRVNDSIRVTGIAQAFAGNFIDGATVKYRVMRKFRYTYPWLLRTRRINYAYDIYPQTEITHGEIKTGTDGKFTIVFKAIPFAALDKNNEPLFDYTVYADITDISGETRSAEKTVSAGYRSRKIASDIPERMRIDSFRSLAIRIENMNGEAFAAEVSVRIARLKEEKRLIRERFWGRPDQFSMSKADYIRYFPNDEYDNEHDMTTWEQNPAIYNHTDSIKPGQQWKVNALTQPGFYVAEITTADIDGSIIRDLHFIELYDAESKQLLRPQYLLVEKGKEVEPGEKAMIELATSADSLYLIQTTSRNEQPDVISSTSLRNGKQKLGVDITEADRGGFGMGWFFVKHNRMYHQSQVVEVPWTNKDLFIEYASYRDKTLPGSKETWKLKVSGAKKEKLAAEMLATMYDASLDQFSPHQWQKPYLWSTYYNSRQWYGPRMFESASSSQRNLPDGPTKEVKKQYDVFLATYVFYPTNRNRGSVEPLWWLNPLDYAYSESRNPRLMRLPKPVLPDSDGDGVADQYDREQTPPGCPVDGNGIRLDSDQDGIPDCEDTEAGKPVEKEIQVRKNFSETAFFYPDLHTDAAGNIEFSFTMPESLTKWKFMAIAHTKEAAFGSSTQFSITQKQLMVQPNHPRFLRQGDKIELAAKVVNLTEKEMNILAELQLFDAITGQPLNVAFKNINDKRAFTVPAGQSIALKFPVEIPLLFDKPVTCRIIAKSAGLSDGEEMVLPILTNRQLVTETIPLAIKGSGTKSFSFDKLLRSGNSSTLQQHSVTAEFTSNPVWQAVQALPYLVEFPYECAEQTWNRYYGNAVGNIIISSSPKIRDVIASWRNAGDSVPGSLQKNPELKNVLLEETPWLLQGKTESAQKKNMAMLWDHNRLEKELYTTWDKLEQLQTGIGGFAWFKGGLDSRYITQYIVTGIGRLKNMAKKTGATQYEEKQWQNVTGKAIRYLDMLAIYDYNELKKNKTTDSYELSDMIIYYLYMRSFFPDIKITSNAEAAYRFFYDRLDKNWTSRSVYMQGMTAITLFRESAIGERRDVKKARAILLSLKENSIYEEELGRYWKNNTTSWYWQDAPVERQAMLIEAFNEIDNDNKTVDELRTWLLKNKQVNSWSTTKATADACYALLLDGSNWLSNETAVEIQLGTTTIRSADNTKEAGTGYFKKTIPANAVQPSMGNIRVTTTTTNDKTSAPAYGSVYWQYFEDLDKITAASSPLKLSKQLFIEKNTATAPVLYPVKDGDLLHPGDKIKVRIELRADRDMEFVHLKDMRAAALEPVNVISRFKWQDGLGYYEMTKDAATHFFIDHLPRGTYVFEYPLFVTHAGNFSNGISSIECMYAPEFAAHSSGLRIVVK